MDSSKEIKNKTTSEVLMNNNKTEGEIKDSAAEAATGGIMWGIATPAAPYNPSQELIHRHRQ